LWIGIQSSFLKVQDGGDGQQWRRRVPRTGVGQDKEKPTED
jgi:hypothetical protein